MPWPGLDNLQRSDAYRLLNLCNVHRVLIDNAIVYTPNPVCKPIKKMYMHFQKLKFEKNFFSYTWMYWSTDGHVRIIMWMTTITSLFKSCSLRNNELFIYFSSNQYLYEWINFLYELNIKERINNFKD